MAAFEPTDDAFQHMTKRMKMYSDLCKTFKEKNSFDYIVLSNMQENESLKMMSIYFSPPSGGFYPPTIMQKTNILIEHSGILDSAPQVRYILKDIF